MMITKDDIIHVFGSVTALSLELNVTPQSIYGVLKTGNTAHLEDKIIGHLYRAGEPLTRLSPNFSGTTNG